MLVAGCSSSMTSPSSSSRSPALSIRSTDPLLTYEGRFAAVAPSDAGVTFVWQASRCTFDFEAEALQLSFDEIRGQSFFDIILDGKATVLALREGQAALGASFDGLPRGRHHLTLFKRSEAAAGSARFRAIELPRGGLVRVAPAPGYATSMLFFGDSITAGANNEDGAVDQWEDRSTHNNARSYGAFTAAAFHADYRNIAVSGMGISEGYTPFIAQQIWDRIAPDPAAPRAELASWQPEFVFVNYGENDESFSKNQGRSFPKNFAADYVKLIRSIRGAYPKAQIVLLRGGMWGGANSEPLRRAWEAAAAELVRSDPRVAHFAFQHWTGTHPRASDHRLMADELIGWLKAQPFAPGK